MGPTSKEKEKINKIKVKNLKPNEMQESDRRVLRKVFFSFHFFSYFSSLFDSRVSNRQNSSG